MHVGVAKPLADMWTLKLRWSSLIPTLQPKTEGLDLGEAKYISSVTKD